MNICGISCSTILTLIHFIFDPVQNERLKFHRLSDATFYDYINTIYQFSKPFLDDKMSTFEECRAYKCHFLPRRQVL